MFSDLHMHVCVCTHTHQTMAEMLCKKILRIEEIDLIYFDKRRREHPVQERLLGDSVNGLAV